MLRALACPKEKMSEQFTIIYDVQNVQVNVVSFIFKQPLHVKSGWK